MAATLWYCLACDEELETLLREKDSKNIKRVIPCAVETYSSFCWLQGVPNNLNVFKRRFRQTDVRRISMQGFRRQTVHLW